MRTIYCRTFLAGLVVAIATGAAAQGRVALLTSIEVKKLVASAQRSDHARLRDHFAALADKYAADARRHRATAQVLTGNPSHPPAVSPGARHVRLADVATTSASTLRELSNHHGRLATGVSSNAPNDGARFENGEGALEPTAEQLREFERDARITTDHRILEEHFAGLAEKYSRAAQKSAAVARGYRSHPNDRGGSFTALAALFERKAELSRESADKAAAAAAAHRR